MINHFTHMGDDESSILQLNNIKSGDSTGRTKYRTAITWKW
jgi:hypothetical protein